MLVLGSSHIHTSVSLAPPNSGVGLRSKVESPSLSIPKATSPVALGYRVYFLTGSSRSDEGVVSTLALPRTCRCMYST